MQCSWQLKQYLQSVNYIFAYRQQNVKEHSVYTSKGDKSVLSSLQICYFSFKCTLTFTKIGIYPIVLPETEDGQIIFCATSVNYVCTCTYIGENTMFTYVERTIELCDSRVCPFILHTYMSHHASMGKLNPRSLSPDR